MVWTLFTGQDHLSLSFQDRSFQDTKSSGFYSLLIGTQNEISESYTLLSPVNNESSYHMPNSKNSLIGEGH